MDIFTLSYHVMQEWHPELIVANISFYYAIQDGLVEAIMRGFTKK